MSDMVISAKNKYLSPSRRRMYLSDLQTINFFRNNPCIACEYLLGIKLLDSQKWILQETWNCKRGVWSCTRNFGKSFLIAIIVLLKAILYENQSIYIVSSVGNQSKETFCKIEEIVLNIGTTSASIDSLKDIVRKECVTSPNNKTGFKHDPASYSVSFYNGSTIHTLNAKPDNIRGKRADLVVFDECAFCAEELVIAVEPFTTQDSGFSTSIDGTYNPALAPLKVPNQIIYASSQDTTDTIFYQRYKESAMKMIAGNREYFACDMPCDTAIEVYMEGVKYPPLLQRSVVDDALKSNKSKGLREYYNIPNSNGFENQIVKWSTIRDNEKDIIPYCSWKPDNRIVLAFDPARTGDNSIVGGMNVYEDPELGLCGDIIYMVNFVDIATKKKYKLDSNRQTAELRSLLNSYNGDNLDYEYIDRLLIDAGSGGGGVTAYGDRLLNDYKDINGKSHHGLIDAENDIYSTYKKAYPNAVNKLMLIDPRKYRTQMVEEFIELMELGVIKFPHEYSGHDYINYTTIDEDGNEKLERYMLSNEEKKILEQIDLMKNEITSIHKTENAEKTSVTYALSKDKANKMHDDRFYVMIMLAHRLYQLRRGSNNLRNKSKKNNVMMTQIRAPQLLGRR